jgi:O-antigen/teichoic acid export membrane protein
VDKSRNILKNAISAISVNLVIGVVTLFLYKYLYSTVGISEFGVWSLVVSTIAVGSVANAALCESVVRFVALYSVKNDWENVSKVLVTSCYILGALLFFFLFIIYAASYYLLPFVVENHKYLALARSLLPYGLLGFWINGIATAFLSLFEGLRLAYIKNMIIAFCSVLYYIGSRLLVPHFGLIGVVYAGVLQAMVLLTISAVLVIIKLPIFSLKPLSLKSDLFKQLVAFSMNLQAISILTIMYDPITKYFMAKYGNMSFVGYYEMGNKVVLLARNLVISAIQILVPNLTIEAEKSIEALKSMYYRIFGIVFSISTFMLTSIVIFLPYISIIYLSHFEPIFVIATVILGIGWYVNIIMSPVYFVNYATNSLKINLNGQFIMAVLNPVFCLILGILFGSYFVIAGWASTLICGAVYIFIASHKKYGINNFKLLKPELGKILWGLFFALLSWLVYSQFIHRFSLYLMIGFATFIFAALAIITIRKDKNFAYIINLIKLKLNPA